MTETKPKRRWFRFSLRTMFVLVTLAAVGLWAYWIGWPWWQIHREQAEFKKSVENLRAGTAWSDYVPVGGTSLSIGEFPTKQLNTEEWPNATYFVLFETDNAADGTIERISKIELFRGPPGPDVYGEVRKAPSLGFMRNSFLELAGDRTTPSFISKYELIYSDPPAK